MFFQEFNFDELLQKICAIDQLQTLLNSTDKERKSAKWIIDY